MFRSAGYSTFRVVVLLLAIALVSVGGCGNDEVSGPVGARDTPTVDPSLKLPQLSDASTHSIEVQAVTGSFDYEIALINNLIWRTELYVYDEVSARGMISKLEDAKKALEAGRVRPAINKLNDYTDQVRGAVNTGWKIYYPWRGDILIGSAERIIERLESWQTVEVYSEDFKNGPGGWVSRDLSQQDDVYWHHVPNEGVMWCGTDDPTYAASPGYGDNWNQYLSKSFSLGASPQSLTYVMQWDTEPNYDFVFIDVSSDGGSSWDTIEAFDGDSEGFLTIVTDLSMYAGNDVVIRYRVFSDGAWSDEDGLYDTDGACRLDHVQVTGYPADTFDAGPDGWVASAAPGTGAEFRLEAQPRCNPGSADPCAESDWPNADSWVAYDESGQFPLSSEADRAQGIYTRVAIESPEIQIPSASRYFLEFDVYRNLPLLDGVYFSWEVAAPPPEAGGSYKSNNFVYYGTTGYETVRFEITDLVANGASSAKIRLSAVDMGWLFGFPYPPAHTAAPFFDNVRIVVSGR